MTAERDHNPYDLKTSEEHGHDKKPDGYLTDEELKKLLVSKNIPFKRTDNLPRFANNNKILMIHPINSYINILIRDGPVASIG